MMQSMQKSYYFRFTQNLINHIANKPSMNFFNNSISDAALIRSLCQHYKRHIQEIDHLQTLNRELEELVAELRTKLEALKDVEEVFVTLEQDTQYTDKEMAAIVRKLDYIKNIKEQSKNTQKNYSNLKKEHARLIERLAKLDMWRSEMEKGK